MASYNFNFNGSLQSYTAPTDGSVSSINITVNGAQGGSGGFSGAGGGLGGSISANYVVVPGQTFYILVGGQGGNGIQVTDGYGHFGGTGGGGGGKSWVGLNTVITSGVILIAGGGGGGGSVVQPYSLPAGAGGLGGYPNGGAGAPIGSQGCGGGGGDGYYGGGGGYYSSSSGSADGGGLGGSQTTGGNYGGSFEAGGVGQSSGNPSFYGGGTGGNGGGTTGAKGTGGLSQSYYLGGGGGGGSSYYWPVSQLSLISNQQGVQTGNGAVTISEILNITLPVVSSGTSESDWSAGGYIGDSVITNGPLKVINTFEPEYLYENDTASIARQDVLSDQPIQVQTSSYKWTTSTLASQQEQYTSQPYIKCQVVDDSLLVNQQLINSTTVAAQTQIGIGDYIQAPDGSILAALKDINGNLVFGQVTDGTQLSQWQNIRNGGGVIISSSWSWYNQSFGSYTGFEIPPSIQCSNYINGNYIVDIYFWIKQSGSTPYYLQHARANSSNFSSWTVGNITTSSGIPSSTTNFFQLAAGKPILNPITGNVSATVFTMFGGIQLNTSSTSFGYYYSVAGSFGGSGEGSLVSWINGPMSLTGNCQDWQLHSFDVEYIQDDRQDLSPTGKYIIVFSGYHSVFQQTNTNQTNSTVPTLATSSTNNNVFYGNFGLYMTQLFTTPTYLIDSGDNVIWDEPREILTFNSSSSQNWNQALYPSLNYDGEALWLTFRLDQTESVSETGTVTNISNYYLSKSLDFKNFNYPVLVVDTDGNTVLKPSYTSNGFCKYSFVYQNDYYYFVGNTVVWQYIQNEITADVSGDVLGVEIQDQAGGASSINLTIANGNGKWAGPSPSGANYQAIWKNGAANQNSKIYLQLGYYTSTGAGETVPRNIYYIDDITQSVNASTNDLVIVGRDFNKVLGQLKTLFTYTFEGPDFFTEQFLYSTGSTTAITNNWNQVTGYWNVINISATTSTNSMNVFVPSTASAGSSTLSGPTLATLSGFLIRHPNYNLSVTAFLPASASGSSPTVNLYPVYVSSSYYLRVEIKANGVSTKISLFYNLGSGEIQAGLSSNGFTISSADYYPIYIRVTDYEFVDIIIGNPGLNGNYYSSFVAKDSVLAVPVPYLFLFPAGFSSSIAIGTSGTFVAGAPTAGFANLKFSQYAPSQNIEELTKRLAALAGVYDFVPSQDWAQDFTDLSQWNGTSYGLPNRTLQVSSGGYAIQNLYQVSNGEIDFDAKASGTASSQNFGFDFVFRSWIPSLSGNQQAYKLRFQNYQASGSLVIVSLLISAETNGGSFLPDQIIYSTGLLTDPSSILTLSGSITNTLLFDLSQWHHYKISFTGGWVYAYIDGIMVFSFYDNENGLQVNGVTNSVPTTGYWGFSLDDQSGLNSFNASSILTVKNLSWPTLWNQINSFTLSPNDDLTSAITSNLQTVYGWYFSDLGGRMKLVILRNTTSPNPVTNQPDPVTYNYGDNATNNLLYGTSNDSSSKEYVNIVYVVGDGVSATASSESLQGSDQIQRIEVITDLKITTVADAQTRANQELLNMQKYNVQPAPKQNIQVGSEILDVVNIADTSTPNATGIDQDLRIYTQSFTVDNKSNFSITLGTGNE